MLSPGRVAEMEPPAEDDGVVRVPEAFAGTVDVAGTIEAIVVDEMAEIPLIRSFKTGTVKLTVLGIADTGMCR